MPEEALPEGWEPVSPQEIPARPFPEESEGEPVTSGIRSLQDLVRRVRGPSETPHEDAGLAEVHPFPFLALVGLEEVKQGLLLALIHPRLATVLILGPTGTGKTTAVYSLIPLLPDVPRSLCYYGCLPEDVEAGGIEALCPQCAEKYRRGEPLAVMEPARLLEVPFPVRPEELWGTLDERLAHQGRFRLRRGLLAYADRQVLFVDEWTRYPPEVREAVVEAACRGHYLLTCGGLSATFRSQFLLVVTADPARGALRFPILDRFALRLLAQPVPATEWPLLWERVQAWRTAPQPFLRRYQDALAELRAEVQAARAFLSRVTVPEGILARAAHILAHLNGVSPRAWLAWVEAARAHAAAEFRPKVTWEDMRQVALMVLRLRRPEAVQTYFATLTPDDADIVSLLEREGRPT